jgi:hypothetical protein
VSAHTPGPWTVGFGATDCRWPQVESGDGVIARTYGSRDEENARLLAAAPDLLAACKQTLAWFESGPPISEPYGIVTDWLRFAIAKAEGGAK